MHAALVERGIIRPDLSDAALGQHGAFGAGPQIGDAVDVPPEQFRTVRASGLEFSFQREIVAPWGDGYTGTINRCRECGRETRLDDDPTAAPMFEGLQGWLDGGPLPSHRCEACGHRRSFGDLELEPRWCAASFVINLWNWSVLRPEFERLMQELLPEDTVLIYDHL